MQLRHFEDLIKPIEIDGETFVPIEEIAKLAFPQKNIKQAKIFDSDRNDFCFITFVKKRQKIIVYIDDKFTVRVYNDDCDWCLDCENQVQIVKNLIKWGFIEP